MTRTPTLLAIALFSIAFLLPQSFAAENSCYGECPDLRPRSPSIGSGIQPSYAAGSTLQVSVVVNNIGDDQALPISKMYYYFSEDSTFDPQQDTLCAEDNIARLHPGQKQAMTEWVLIPPDTPPGTRYLFFFADAQNVVIEDNENNNVVSKAIEVH